MSVRDALCRVCGQGYEMPHKTWCDRVAASLAVDPTTWCVVPGCHHIVSERGLLCDLHSVELEEAS